jgi:uncharacterized protein (TIGR03083 family)
MSDSEFRAPPNKADLLDALRRTRASLDEILDQLSEQQWLASGADGWTVKHHVAHLTAWEQGIVGLLRHRNRAEAMGLDRAMLASDVDVVNAAIHVRHRDRPLSDVQADYRRSYAELVTTLEALSEEDLYRPYAHYYAGAPDSPDVPGADDNRPIVGWIIGNTFGHYAEHMGWIKALIDTQD